MNLTRQFLIAMPNLVDPIFERTLAYICDHNERGAMGVIVNRPLGMALSSLFEQIDVELHRPDVVDLPVHFGGPVQTDRGFVLHQPLGEWQSTLAVSEEIGLTTSKDILLAVGEGAGPEHLFVTLATPVGKPASWKTKSRRTRGSRSMPIRTLFSACRPKAVTKPPSR